MTTVVHIVIRDNGITTLIIALHPYRSALYIDDCRTRIIHLFIKQKGIGIYQSRYRINGLKIKMSQSMLIMDGSIQQVLGITAAGITY